MYDKALSYIISEKKNVFNKLEDNLLSYENGVIGKDDYEFEVKFITRSLQVYRDLIFDRFGKDFNNDQWFDVFNLFESYFLQIAIVYVLNKEKMA